MLVVRPAIRYGIDARPDEPASSNRTWIVSAPPAATLEPHDEHSESINGRMTYVSVVMVCMFGLAFMMGSRAKQLRLHNLMTTSFVRILVNMSYILAVCFVLGASVLESGFGLRTTELCRGAIIVCLIFYVGNKVVMYFFLIERAHAPRSPYLRRFSDWIWIVSSTTVITGFGSMAVFAFMHPLAELSQVDGQCRIGVPLKITVPLLVFDVVINTGLTVVFIYLLIPLLSIGPGVQGLLISPPAWTTKLTVWFCHFFQVKQHPDNAQLHPSNRSFLKGVETLLWKSLIGALLVLLPTVANLGLLYHMKGREQGWLCLTICILDVTWAVCVIHWLTVDPIEINGRALGMMHPADTSSAEVSNENGVIHL